MKRLIWPVMALLVGLAVGAAGGYGVGIAIGESRAFAETADYLHEGGTPPWAGQGDEGLALCLTLTEGEDEGDRCLSEVKGTLVPAEDTPGVYTGSPTPAGSPTPEPSPTMAPSMTPSPTATRTPLATRGARD